jgi:hypothetical protein
VLLRSIATALPRKRWDGMPVVQAGQRRDGSPSYDAAGPRATPCQAAAQRRIQAHQVQPQPLPLPLVLPLHRSC